jgi:hypothetical protein
MSDQPASLQVGRYVRRADGRVQAITRVLRTVRSGAWGTPVEVQQVEVLAGDHYEYVVQYTEAQRKTLASLTGKRDYPAAEVLTAATKPTTTNQEA